MQRLKDPVNPNLSLIKDSFRKVTAEVEQRKEVIDVQMVEATWRPWLCDPLLPQPCRTQHMLALLIRLVGANIFVVVYGILVNTRLYLD